MQILTDFHSHILPGIDDGSANVEESLRLLSMEAAQGIRKVVATPHFYAQYDTPGIFLERRGAAEKKLREAMCGHDELPEVIVGAEVSFFRGMSESEWLPHLAMGESGCILVEMPFAPWTEEIYRELGEIWNNQGLTPILAHIDRYIAPFRTRKILKRLEQLPVLVQANGEFFLNRSTEGLAMRMLRSGQIHLLGSDCHNLSSRKPNLGQVTQQIRKKLGQDALDWLFRMEQEILGVEAPF